MPMVAHSHVNCNSRRPDNFFNLCGLQAARGTQRYTRARHSYRQNKIKLRKTGFLYSPASQHPDFSLDLPGSFNLQGQSLPWESVQTLTYTPNIYILKQWSHKANLTHVITLNYFSFSGGGQNVVNSCHRLNLDCAWENSTSIRHSKSLGSRAEQLTTAICQRREAENQEGHLSGECLIKHQLKEGVAVPRDELDMASARNSRGN